MTLRIKELTIVFTGGFAADQAAYQKALNCFFPLDSMTDTRERNSC